MKTRLIGRKALLCAVLLLCLVLSACDGSPAPAPEATPAETDRPLGLDIYTAPQQGTLAEKLTVLCAPYQQILTKVSSCGCRTLDYVIPGQKFSEAGDHARQSDASAQNGRYSFTLDLGGDFSYTLWGQEVLDGMETAVPDFEAVEPEYMEAVSGDTQTAGGGVFSHRYVYDIAGDGTSGAIEVYSALNGVISGHERFDYLFRDGKLYFTDAVLDAYSMTEGSYPYILTQGVIAADSLELAEFTRVASSAGVPAGYVMPASLDESRLTSQSGLSCSLSVRDGRATEVLNGTTRTYTLK